MKRIGIGMAIFFLIGSMSFTKAIRVVALVPNAVDIIHYLHEDKSIVGTSNYSTVSQAKKVGDIVNPNIEAILELNPTLVIADSYTSATVLNRLRHSGIDVVTINKSYTLQGMYASFLAVGKVYHKESNIKNLINSIQNLLKNNNQKTGKKLYYMLSYGRNGDYSVNQGSFTSDIIEALGFVNITKNAKTSMVSKEYLILKNPDIIVVSQDEKNRGINTITTQGLKKTVPYCYLNAVKNNHIYYVDAEISDRPSPSIIQFIRFLIAVKKAVA